MEANFYPGNVQHILSIPIAVISGEDQLIWHWDRCGVYSAKLGYQLACKLKRLEVYQSTGDLGLELKRLMRPFGNNSGR